MDTEYPKYYFFMARKYLFVKKEIWKKMSFTMKIV